MAVKESREVVIEASPKEILDVIADVEAMPEWSSIHQSAEVLERDDGGSTAARPDESQDGRRHGRDRARLHVARRRRHWTQESAKASRSQEGGYTLTPEGDKTRTKFDLNLDPTVPLPGFVIKRAMKGIMETGPDGLRKRVLKVKKGG